MLFSESSHGNHGALERFFPKCDAGSHICTAASGGVFSREFVRSAQLHVFTFFTFSRFHVFNFTFSRFHV